MKAQIVSIIVGSSIAGKRGILIPQKNNLFINLSANKINVYNIDEQNIGAIQAEIDLPEFLFNKIMTFHELQTILGNPAAEFGQFYNAMIQAFPEPEI